MVSLGCLKISFLFLATVLIFFIAGLLSNAPRARRSLGAYRIPWRPAFSSHLINASVEETGTSSPLSLKRPHNLLSAGKALICSSRDSVSGPLVGHSEVEHASPVRDLN